MKKNNDHDRDFFEEDDSIKSSLIKYLIGIVCLLILVLVLVLVNKSGKKEDSNKSVQDVIKNYSTETIKPDADEVNNPEMIDEVKSDDVPETTIIDRKTDEGATPAPTESPEPVPTKTPEGEVMEKTKDYSKIKFDVKSCLSEMEGFFIDNNDAAISDLAHLDKFIAMSYSFSGTTDYAYYGDVNSKGEPDGVGIACYADNQYYYGDWKDGMRHGDGKWVHFHIHTKKNNDDIYTYHQYAGQFAYDLPNGLGQDHYEFDNDKLKDDGTYYISNYIGSYKDGLCNGDFYCTVIDRKGSFIEVDGKAENGKFAPLSESRDTKKRRPVFVFRENPDGYIWWSDYENQDVGVISYISSKK